MRPVWQIASGAVLAASLWSVSILAEPARAQNAPVQTAQLPPLQEQAPQPGSPSVPYTPYRQAPAPYPYQQAPGPQTQYQQSPSPQTPYQQAPAPQTPYQQAPVPYTPYQQTPAPQAPYQPAPALQTPYQQAPVQQAPHQPVPVPHAPTPSSPSGPDAQAQGQTPPVVPPTTFDRPNTWTPASVAKLVALDKVNAQATELTIKVGQSASFESLTITVKACVIRPPDQPADAAVYLHVTDSHPDSPGFDGWMLEDEPSVSMLQHPIYDIRLAGCG